MPTDASSNSNVLQGWLILVATFLAVVSSAISAWIASRSLRIQEDQMSAYRAVNIGVIDIKPDDTFNSKGERVFEILIHIKNFGQTPVSFKIEDQILTVNGIKIIPDFDGASSKSLMPTQELFFSLGSILVEKILESDQKAIINYKILGNSAIYGAKKFTEIWECWSIEFHISGNGEEVSPDIALIDSRFEIKSKK